MSSEARFLYRIVIEPAANPQGTCDWVREELRSWISERGLGYGMGALGGSRVLYGDIGFRPPATETDRQALAAWLLERHMSATVQLGPLQEGKVSLLDPITVIVFDVDTLTEAERAEAAERYADGRRRVEGLRKALE